MQHLMTQSASVMLYSYHFFPHHYSHISLLSILSCFVLRDPPGYALQRQHEPVATLPMISLYMTVALIKLQSQTAKQVRLHRQQEAGS